jgi:FtsZ-interacting cell division protein ZipA
MASWIWIVIVIAVAVIIALLAAGARKRRTALLRDRFGPEYDRAVETRDDRHAAEADLRAREKQRAQIDVKPLSDAARLRFADEWRDVQERFVDQPGQAVAAADTLIARIMQARGYPVDDFEGQAELVSVDHPDVVENYRIAHAIRQRSETQQASTEDLREALLRYRSLSDRLLRP